MRLHVLRQPRIQECARPPRLTCVGCGPHLCRAAAVGVASRGVCSTHGSRCWGRLLIPSPSSATISPGSGPDSRLTVYVTQVRVALF
jgi:hypothetical protein